MTAVALIPLFPLAGAAILLLIVRLFAGRRGYSRRAF